MSKNTHKILVVADTLDITTSSGGKASYALVDSMFKAGFELTILHYSHKPITIQQQTVDPISTRKRGYYFLAKFFIVAARIFKYNFKTPIAHIRGFSFDHTADVLSIKHALKKHNPAAYDAVFALSYAGSFRSHKALLAVPAWHAIYIPYIHDPYPHHTYPRPYDWVEPGHRQQHAFMWDLFDKAYRVAYPSQLLADLMESYFLKGAGKALIIPHQIAAVDTSSIDLPQWLDTAAFNVVHAGSLMDARNPVALIEAFLELTQESAAFKEHATLTFIRWNDMFNGVLKHPLFTAETIHIHKESLPLEIVLKIQENVAVNVILEAQGSVSPFLPGKFAHCVQSDKPILLIGPALSESKRLLGDTYPYHAESRDTESIKKVLRVLYDNWLQTGGNERLDRPDLQAYCDYGHLKEVIESVY